MAATSSADTDYIESSKYLVLGNVDAGKSSLIGVLTKIELDDGNGLARSKITRIKHELESGKTSTCQSHYLTKDNEITTLVDLCGHIAYFRTTLFAITGMFGDYGIIVLGANMGMCEMAKEYFNLMTANRIPFIVVVTKIDICPVNVLTELRKKIEKMANKFKKSFMEFNEEEELINGSYLKEGHYSIIESFQNKEVNMMPTIMVSNKTGFNINFLREFIMTLRPQHYLQRTGQLTNDLALKPDYPPVMFIDSSYNVPGIGIVLAGTVKYGSFKLGQKVLLGPHNNEYISVTIKSIHNCISKDVNILREDESGSFGIRLDVKKSFSKDMFTKGQIITTDMDFAMRHTCFNFSCDIAIFNHSTTISKGYECVIHCRTIRQTGKFDIADNIVLRSTSVAKNINISFKKSKKKTQSQVQNQKNTYKAEFILPGTKFMFRDGRTKGIGKVVSVTSILDDPEYLKPKKLTKKKIE